MSDLSTEFRTLHPVLRGVMVAGLLYIFLVAIGTLSSVMKSFGLGHAEDLIYAMPPISALCVGILATVLVQSSSVTTSLIVGVAVVQKDIPLDLAIAPFVPMIMGANIGTTVTNTLASLGSVTRTAEFERAFAGATIHDFFNLLTVIVLLPLELATGYLTRTAVWLVQTLQLDSGVEYKSPIKTAVKVGTKFLGSITEIVGLSGTTQKVSLIILAICLIFVALIGITKNMRVLVANRLEEAINRALKKSGLLGMGIGVLVTVAVQSSSITTSILIPMFGAGILTHRNGFPIMLGANVGTTVTAILAAVVKGPAGLALAFTHLLFNLSGILLFYPIPALRDVPIRLAQALARKTTNSSRWWVLAYIGGVFVVLPLLGMLIFR